MRILHGALAWLLYAAVIAGTGALLGLTLHTDRDPQTAVRPEVRPEVRPAGYVGQAVCAGCHAREAELWRGSHHDRAMAEATPETVLGDFNDATFTHFGVTSTFFRRDGRFFVRTDGPDGTLQDYEIAYAFGFYPLQQYLIGFPDGRYQALGIAWDSRPADQGGQRWFHLYPEESIAHGDVLHWTGRDQNWNFMCAECHSTGLRKNYDLAADRFRTTWSEINVSCEACHGPGAGHVAWASAGGGRPAAEDDGTKGLAVRFGDPAGGGWTDFDSGRGILRWSGPPRRTAELEACAPCHALRRPLADGADAGHRFLDGYVPRLLDEGLYFADGQIRSEVYEYGSFLQSRMQRAGVTCSDCHEPHSLTLRAPGNDVCAQCHVPSRFDTAEHHHHTAGAPGGRCADCHMPVRTYMVVDPRRDHSFRIPRPDLSVALGTPNACTQCHADRPAAWAAETVARWYGPGRRTEPHYGTALQAGRQGQPWAEAALAALATDGAQPAIVRATALSLLPRDAGPAALRAERAGLADAEPLVRLAAVQALAALPPRDRLQPAGPLLRDPVKAVRIAAARTLAAVPAPLLPPEQRAARDAATAEFVAAELAAAERPESHLNLGALYAEQGRMAEAETAYRTALRLDPHFVPALLNLADIYRSQRRDADAAGLLEQAVALAPADADAQYALGLLRVRQGRRSEAVAPLRRAAELRPEAARFAYAYGLVLQATGDVDGAIAVLADAQRRHPADRDLLVALATLNRDKGDLAAAVRYAEDLVLLAPDDQSARMLLDQLRRARNLR